MNIMIQQQRNLVPIVTNLAGVPLPTNPKFINRTDSRFGDLFVIEYAGKRGKWQNHYWKVRCDCGVEKDVTTNSLVNGRTNCGCKSGRNYREEDLEIHGMSKTRVYAVWVGMIRRCCESTNKGYARYGGRGITVCDRWINSFVAFNEDMGPRPSDQHSIDRIDNDGNYEPGNCRWATLEEQGRNRSTNHLITIDGESKCMMDWCELAGVTHKTFHFRLKAGWAPEEIVEISLHKKPVIAFPSGNHSELAYWRGWNAGTHDCGENDNPYGGVAARRFWLEGLQDRQLERSRYAA